MTHFAVSKKDDSDGQSLRELMLSETSNTVGGLTNVTSDLFKAFDYVALGHIHTRFASPSQRVQYSGSPVAFNVKEAKRKEEKGVYILDLDATGDLFQTFHPLEVKRPILPCRRLLNLECHLNFIRSSLVKRLGLPLIFNCPVVRN